MGGADTSAAPGQTYIGTYRVGLEGNASYTASSTSPPTAY